MLVLKLSDVQNLIQAIYISIKNSALFKKFKIEEFEQILLSKLNPTKFSFWQNKIKN